MKRTVVFIITMFLACLFIPGTVQAKTQNAFEFHIVSEGENTCRITEIRIKKDKGISVLKIPDTINGKTVVSIGVGKKKIMSSEEDMNAFLMYDNFELGWICDFLDSEKEERQVECRVSKIKKIILPDTIKEIKDFAFAGLKGLKTIQLSKNLITIGDCAFGHTSISKMHLPEGLTAIGKQLFFKSPINDINIPVKLKDGVADLARSRASWKRFVVSKKNPYYKVKKNMLFSKGEKTLYAMLKPQKNIRISNKVKTIDSFVFYKASSQSVYLGAGVQQIDGCALSTKTRCRITLSPSNPYLARSGMCIYRKKGKELLVGIPKGRVFRISRKVKKLVAGSISLVGIGKKYRVKKVYIPKSVETIEYGWRLGGFVHKKCRYYTERSYWTFQP